jgi:hypothetical protein
MMLRWFPVLAALMATSAMAQGGPGFPIRGYEFCTQPIQTMCPATLTPTVDRHALYHCLRDHWDSLAATCQMNVREHTITPSDCIGNAGDVIDRPTCPTGKACAYTHTAHAHPTQCLTDLR